MDIVDLLLEHEATKAKQSPGPSFRLGTITSSGPVLVRLDGDESEVASTPHTLSDVTNGDRVLVLIYNRTMTIIGRIRGAIMNLSTQDLNSLTRSGVYFQRQGTDGTLDRNYPAHIIAGMLEVFNSTTTFVYQRFTQYQGSRVWERTYYSGTWHEWKEFSLARVAKGSTTIGSVAMNGSLSPKVQVTFPSGLFTTKPHVTFECSNGRLIITATNVSATGFELGADNWSTGASPSVTVYWRAVQDG